MHSSKSQSVTGTKKNVTKSIAVRNRTQVVLVKFTDSKNVLNDKYCNGDAALYLIICGCVIAQKSVIFDRSAVSQRQ